MKKTQFFLLFAVLALIGFLFSNRSPAPSDGPPATAEETAAPAEGAAAEEPEVTAAPGGEARVGLTARQIDLIVGLAAAVVLYLTYSGKAKQFPFQQLFRKKTE